MYLKLPMRQLECWPGRGESEQMEVDGSLLWAGWGGGGRWGEAGAADNEERTTGAQAQQS